MSDFTLFTFYIIAVLGAGIFGIAFFWVWKVSRKKELSGSFNMKLFQVMLPPVRRKEDLQIQQIRDKIAIMEKLFAALHDVGHRSWFRQERPIFAFEITVPHTGEEIIFYIAVPRLFSHSIAKIVESVYPDAQVIPVKDYNIFNPEGQSVGALMEFERNDFLPIRTYRALESDPLRELSNAFSKLERVGEGAAFQIVMRPAPKKRSKEILLFAKKIFERGQFHKESALKEVMEDILGIGHAKVKKPEEMKKEEMKRLSPKEEEMVRAVENKAAKPLFEVNLRLIASARESSQAEEILRNLEAAFSQFDEPTLNMFKIKRLSGNSLKNLFYRFSFRIFSESESSLLSSEELTSLLHFPNVELETPKIKVVKAKESSPPADLPREGVLLGYNPFRGAETPIYITKDDRRRHLYILGQTGTGKTAFMENMIRQDIEAGEGVCFIDPHGDTVQRILGLVPERRLEEVIYFNPGDVSYPMGLNMLEYDPRFPEQKTFVVNELLSIFQKLFGQVPESMGPIFEQYFRNSTLLVMEDPASGNTLLEIQRIFADPEFRQFKVSKSKNVVVNTFWREMAEKATGEQAISNYGPYITSKFDNFLANEIMRPIIAQERSAFNFRDVIDNKKILLINLSKGRLGELNSSLIGLIMVGKLLMASLSRVDMPETERNDFYLYIDEFQNVTTPSIATILSEARKYKLDLIITHQFIGQLDEQIKKAVFGNVGSMVSFRIGADDTEFMAKQFEPVFDQNDLLNVDNYNAFVKILTRGQTSKPFNIRTYPPVQPNAEIAERIKEYSRAKYGRPREEVEREIFARYKV